MGNTKPPPTPAQRANQRKQRLIIAAGAVFLVLLLSLCLWISNALDKKADEKLANDIAEKKSQEDAEFSSRVEYHYQMLVFAVKDEEWRKVDDLIAEFQQHDQVGYKDVRMIIKQDQARDYLNELAQTPLGEHRKRRELYRGLLQLFPENSSYREEYDQNHHALIAQNTTARAAANREKNIERQFSAWDGSHTKLKQLIKSAMHDASSFEHVETKYWKFDDHIVVTTHFRGKNLFGAKALSWVKAKFSVQGDFIEILEESN